MKQISSALQQHLAQNTTTLATCWKLTRRDSTVMGFTDLDRDLVMDGVTYKAASGFTPSAIENTSSLSVDNLELEGMLSDGDIAEGDILSGLYDYAEIEIFLVNYKDLTQGKLALRTGWLGEVALNKQTFIVEVRGLMQRLSGAMGSLFSASCRATLGDSKCAVNLTSHTVSGAVTTSYGLQSFTDTSRTEADGLFDAGLVTFTSGANNGLQMEVKHYRKDNGGFGLITLVLPLPATILQGDAYTVSKGCDKSLSTCYNIFNNVANFRGEPLVPGIDRMLETAGTRSNW